MSITTTSGSLVEFTAGGSGDMTDVKAEKVVKTQKLQDGSSTNGHSPSGVWSSNLNASDYFADKGASSPLGIGDGDKASFPVLGASSSSDEKQSAADRRSKKGGGGGSGGGSDSNEDDLSVSVSQAGKKYIITKRNLIVNYLPQTFSDRQLFNLFVSYGPIDSVKIMRDATVCH